MDRYTADDLRHIATLRELIEDATARIGELEASGRYHMTARRGDALEDELNDARWELHRAETALLDDYGLTYEAAGEIRPEKITRTCEEGLAALERIQREFEREGVAA